ncbi:MAG: hypothetical protein NTV06_06530, partial [candidate division Zixibacteria bacterium]|nr:hypothetical protein [candidate division Zixibacteria bacterium]
ETWDGLPAASFLLLDVEKDFYAREITRQIRGVVDVQLERFSKHSGVTLDIKTLIERLFIPNAKKAEYRSIFTAILSFLLESKERAINLELRSHYGGTLEPFLTHLFKGGLIFESLLKQQYGAAGHTLGNYLNEARVDLELNSQIYRKKNGSFKFEDLPTHLRNWSTESFQERAVATAYAVRNTAGHDLAWQDVFNNGLYGQLFEGIVDAIFLTIKKAYIK